MEFLSEEEWLRRNDANSEFRDEPVFVPLKAGRQTITCNYCEQSINYVTTERIGRGVMDIGIGNENELPPLFSEDERHYFCPICYSEIGEEELSIINPTCWVQMPKSRLDSGLINLEDNALLEEGPEIREDSGGFKKMGIKERE